LNTAAQGIANQANSLQNAALSMQANPSLQQMMAQAAAMQQPKYRMPTELQVGQHESDASVYEFLVGRVKPGYYSAKIIVYPEFEDLPEDLQPVVSVLKAAFDTEKQVAVKVPGAGSARRLFDGELIYFRVAY